MATLISLSIASAPMVVFAQTDDERAAARATASEGAKAFSEKRWGDAIDLFLKAESLVHAPPHLLYLARSYEKLGKLVKAQETYSKLTHETIAPDKPKVFQDAKDSAMKELSSLEPRVPTLKTSVLGVPAGKVIKVMVDGVEMNSALLGLNRPVDPGEHKLEATADGLSSEVATITLLEGAHESVTLTLRPAAPVVATTTATTGAGHPDSGVGATTSAPDRPPVSARDTPSSGGGSKWLGIGLIGVGVVGLGLGTVFMLKSSSKSKEADDACGGPPPCAISTKDQVQSLDDQSKSAKTLGLVGLAVGGLAAVGGVVVLLSSGSSSSSSSSSANAAPSKPSVTPWIGLGSLGLNGSF